MRRDSELHGIGLNSICWTVAGSARVCQELLLDCHTDRKY